MSYSDSARRLSSEAYFNGFSEITPSKVQNVKDSVKYMIEKMNGNDRRRSSSENISEEIKQHFCNPVTSNGEKGGLGSCSNAQKNEKDTKINLFQNIQKIH